MKFDYISDIHLDYWVKIDSNSLKMQKKIKEFTELIIPEKPSEILIIAGDIGHYNFQNNLLITYLKEVYKIIFYVFGNHDYYLQSKQMKKKLKNSINRVNMMEEEFDKLGNVFRLDGQVIEIDGVRFGGCDMWYDFSYGMNYLHYTKDEVYSHWWDNFRDAKFQSGMPETIDRFESEKEKAKNIECDVFVSHVPPFGVPVPSDYVTKKEYLSYYTFDGEGLFQKEKPKVWISGHMHQTFQSEFEGIKMIGNAIGYPENRLSIPKKIKTY